MSTESLAEIIESAGEMKTKKEKIAYLLEKNSKPLRNILKVTYDKSMELNIPSSAPPYVPSEMPDSHGMLFRETRKLPYFVKGFDGVDGYFCQSKLAGQVKLGSCNFE